jgi:hypothetical protein
VLELLSKECSTARGIATMAGTVNSCLLAG